MKVKANIPEIFVGVFLTLAVFATGMVLESSRRSPAQQQSTGNTTNENNAHPKESSFWDWIAHDAAGFFTFWLVVVGGGQIGLFYWQLRLIRGAADDAKKAGIAAERAADATAASVDLARDTAQRQLRAYVHVEFTKITRFDVDQIAEARLLVKNTGQTPAYNVVGRAVIEAREFPIDPARPLEIHVPIPTTRTIMGPGGVLEPSGVTKVPLTGPQVASIRNGSGALYVFGEMTYRDTFGIDRYTRFRYLYGGRFGANSEGRMVATEEGNEAN